MTSYLPGDRARERPAREERFRAVDLRDGSTAPHAVIDQEGRIVSRWPRGSRARREAGTQARAAEYRALEDDVLRRAARLDPADQSLAARQARETAASILDHREDAARRAVRAAADALGVTAPPAPGSAGPAESQVRRTAFYQDQAVFLCRLRDQRDRGELDEETAQWEATLYRDADDMNRAAQGLAAGGGGGGNADAARWAPGESDCRPGTTNPGDRG